ncbi:MAG: hypothetical protein WBH47_04695 [Streptosporangiaceae bacterium]
MTTTTTTPDVTAIPAAPVPADWIAGTWVIDPAHTADGTKIIIGDRVDSTIDVEAFPGA